MSVINICKQICILCHLIYHTGNISASAALHLQTVATHCKAKWEYSSVVTVVMALEFCCSSQLTRSGLAGFLGETETREEINVVSFKSVTHSLWIMQRDILARFFCFPRSFSFCRLSFCKSYFPLYSLRLSLFHMHKAVFRRDTPLHLDSRLEGADGITQSHARTHSHGHTAIQFATVHCWETKSVLLLLC